MRRDWCPRGWKIRLRERSRSDKGTKDEDEDREGGRDRKEGGT